MLNTLTIGIYDTGTIDMVLIESQIVETPLFSFQKREQ